MVNRDGVVSSIACGRNFSPEIISFTIHEYSGYVKDFHPDNILVNSPHDQSSRWSSSAKDTNQFVTLKISMSPASSFPLAIVKEISFGKFHLPHVCNLKEFKVLLSIDGVEWKEALYHGLKNDGVPETFPLRILLENFNCNINSKVSPDLKLHPTNKNGYIPYPVQFIRIVPIATWGIGFNFGIWFIQLRGLQYDHKKISEAVERYAQLQVVKNMKLSSQLWLKYPLQNESTITLAHLFDQLESNEYGKEFYSLIKLIRNTPLLELLDIKKMDRLIETFVTSSLDKGCMNKFTSTEWTKISQETGKSWPPARGGHQLMFDPPTQRLFLFGGWDGQKDLADFWYYDCSTQEWTLISSDVSSQGGPSARSVHRCVIDYQRRWLYSLGSFSTASTSKIKEEVHIASDFYRCNLETFEWELLSTDTKMVFDEQTQKIWVFGGRVCISSMLQPIHSGLFSFDTGKNLWREHLSDLSESCPLQSRASFMMFLDYILVDEFVQKLTPVLIILNGQRHLEEIREATIFNLEEEKVVDLKNLNLLTYKKQIDFLVKAPSYALKGIYFPEEKEIIVLAPSNNSFDIFSHRFGREFLLDSNYDWNKWESLLSVPVSQENPRPATRYAFNLTGGADPSSTKRNIWLFGGNVSHENIPQNGEVSSRNDELWRLSLSKTSPEELTLEMKALVRQCAYISIFLICCRFIEKIAPCINKNSELPGLTQELKIEALEFLRREMKPFLWTSSPKIQTLMSSMPELLFLGTKSSLYSETLSTQTMDMESLAVLSQIFSKDPAQFHRLKLIIECRKALMTGLLCYVAH